MSRKQFRTILMKEVVALLKEECGCGGDESHKVYQHDGMVSNEEEEVGDLSREEALALVEMIARKTTCPLTREALMSVVHELSEIEGSDMNSDDAFGAGYSMGQDERDEFSYTGDLPRGRDEAMGLGYRAGVMGLEETDDGG
tara:strand:- start:53 stop:478 length:426 start_codon:yes stop_codon:yes gene_type:complete